MCLARRCYLANATAAETLLIQVTAEKYRKNGYEVSEEVPLDFLPGFSADLVAERSDETKIVVVKSRSSLAAEARIGELARIVESKPGWSFELLLVGEPEKLDSPSDARPFIGDETMNRAVEAENSLRAGFPEAAFLLAWSACEAIVSVGRSGGSIKLEHYKAWLHSRSGCLCRRDFQR